MALAKALPRRYLMRRVLTGMPKSRNGLTNRSMISGVSLMIITGLKGNCVLKHSLTSKGLWISDATGVYVTDPAFLSADKAPRITPGHVKGVKKPLQTRKKLLNK